MDLETLVPAVFATDGLLARAVPEFQPRPGQVEMATAIARALQLGGALVVEAGTGIGKTYAYLVPALLSGARIVISTATKTLQDQLFGRDLPHLIHALGLHTRTSLLKGRSSYLCLHRLDIALQNVPVHDPVDVRTLAEIGGWAIGTRTGDLAELSGLDERSLVIPLVTSSRENCLGSRCPQSEGCHVNKARRDGLAADVVVINHHLFFADARVRGSGMAELLPSVQTVIFDEAHQLNEIGVQFLGDELSTGQLLDFARDMVVCGLEVARGLVDWQTLAFETECVARDLRMIVGKTLPGVKLGWTGAVPDQVNAAEWCDAMVALQAKCTEAMLALDLVSQTAPDLARLGERSRAIVSLLDRFSGCCPTDAVRWLEVGTQLKLVEAPLDMSMAFKALLIRPQASGAVPKSFVFTSATLGDDASLSWFTEPCGLAHAEILKVGSPFDYARQASLYVPQNMLNPGGPDHSGQVADLVARMAVALGGRTLVLTTTLRALQVISKALQGQFCELPLLEILVQGQKPKRELLDRFRQGSQAQGAGCVLVASASFWEGVDVPGDSLQLVVIDKLPFPPPSDPLVEAHVKRLENAGKNAFKHYFLPQTAMSLRQGAGRLIRRESDYGVLVVCDSRLAQRGYGKRLLAALPPMKRLESEDQLQEALTTLTRISTRDLC